MNHIEINLFKHSHAQFLKMLADKKIEYDEIQKFKPGTILNSGSTVTVIVTLIQASAPWAAIAGVLIEWIKSKSSRKIIITTKDHTIIHLEGMSQKDVEKILNQIKNITVIDTKASEND